MDLAVECVSRGVERGQERDVGVSTGRVRRNECGQRARDSLVRAREARKVAGVSWPKEHLEVRPDGKRGRRHGVVAVVVNRTAAHRMH